MRKKWEIREPISGDFKNQYPEIEPAVLQLLYNRGITDKKEIEQFLNPDYDADTHDPFLFQDMQKSVERILQAIENKEKITIHGDYDADGVCSSAIVATILKDLGADFDVYLPHREKEGYGVNVNTIEYLEKEGTKLIITVDCGTANIEPIELAESKGINVIVTDHHHVPEEIPKSFALINPQNEKDNYPFPFLCGAGVAFKLAQALLITDLKSDKPKLAAGYDKWLLDLVAIATIADMMPLNDENRVLVKYGLVVMKKTRRPGLKRLMEMSGVWKDGPRDITPFDVGFMIAPRINAAGRMDHANSAYHLLMEDGWEKIEDLVRLIEENNTERRAVTERVVEEAVRQFTDVDDKYLLFAYARGWPIGLAGLTASKILQQYGKPVIVMTKLEDRIAGSGRSIPGFDMAKALEAHGDLFETSGGHAMACGFSFTEDKTKPSDVQEMFESEAKKALEGKDLRPELVIDAKLSGSEVNWKLYDQIVNLQPYGKANDEPIFYSTLEVEEARTVGAGDKHLKLRLKDPKLFKSFSAIGFGLGFLGKNLQAGSQVDIAYKLDSNVWNGNKELQMKVEDLNVLDKDNIL